MLCVLSENTSKHLIPIVDAHTHIGKEEVRDAKGITYRRNTLRDLVDFAEKLKFEIIKRINQQPEFFRYQIPDDPTDVAIPTYSLKQKITQLINPKFNFGWLVDSSWVFPFNDVLKDRTIPRFVKVNDRTLSQILTPEKAIRFFPFARVDPHDGEKATEEVVRAFYKGARGLKLHPISQHFVERICSPEVIGIVTKAAKLGLPVIFDVANAGVAEDILALVQEIRQNLRKDTNFSVVLGHFGFDYTSTIMYEILEDQNIYCETSGMRGEDVEIFFRNVCSIPNWSQKVLYGSDHNYFGALQSADFITFTLSHKFNEITEGNLADIRRILGANAFSLVNSIWLGQRQSTPHPPIQIAEDKLEKKLGDFLKQPKNCLIIDPLTSKDGEILEEIWILGLYKGLEQSRLFICERIFKKSKVSAKLRLFDVGVYFTKVLDGIHARNYPINDLVIVQTIKEELTTKKVDKSFLNVNDLFKQD